MIDDCEAFIKDKSSNNEIFWKCDKSKKFKCRARLPREKSSMLLSLDQNHSLFAYSRNFHSKQLLVSNCSQNSFSVNQTARHCSTLYIDTHTGRHTQTGRQTHRQTHTARHTQTYKFSTYTVIMNRSS